MTIPKDTKTILIIDDDQDLCASLVRSLSRRGLKALSAPSTEEALTMIDKINPDYALVDLKMGGASGLECVRALHAFNREMKIVVMTGYAAISTAVSAIKLGAISYLSKPANPDDILNAFKDEPPLTQAVPVSRQSSIKTLEWETIHEVLRDSGYNISETARRLGMHRRTLVRKLAKNPVK
jgi:two-component system, response regulator RegA